ncbi:MAG: RNA polymerase sigma factor [Chloroflexota bacterium]
MDSAETGAEGAARAKAPTSQDEPVLIAALRRGDERVFTSLIERYHASLVRLATVFVGDRAVAEEVAQETWLGVLHGIDRFEGRSSIKTWIFTILTNRAKTRGQRESRSVPFSALDLTEEGPTEPAVEPERFRPAGDRWEGGWISFPRAWDDLPEERVVSRETRAQVASAIAALPTSQRQVMTLRDVEGWSADEVCNALGLSETNQRVLLHRARSKARRALEAYFDVK